MSKDYPSPLLSLGRRGLEAYATVFVEKYAPECLRDPQPLPVDEILGDMGLQVVELPLSQNKEIMAACIMQEGPADIFGPRGREEQRFAPGTVLVDPRVRSFGLGAWRNTLIHEAIHWEKDRDLFAYIAHKTRPILCRAFESGRLLWPERTWLGRAEWQAHRLAPRVLMPLGPFRQALAKKLPLHGSCASLLQDLGDTFLVSKASAALRIRELGLEQMLSSYPDQDAHLRPSPKQEFYAPITTTEALELYHTNLELRQLVDEWPYIYVIDGYFVKKDLRYLFKDRNGNHRLKSIAPNFLKECALNISVVQGRSYGSAWAEPAWAFHRSFSDVDDRLLFFHKDHRFNFTYDPEEAYAYAYEAIAGYDEEKEKAYLRIIQDLDLSLCQSLAKIMTLKNWNYPSQFEEETRLNKDYFYRIHKDRYNGMGKGVLMAICIALGLNHYLTEHLMHKAGMTLKRYQEPDRTYIRILEIAPGLPIDDFNGLLKQAGLQELGSNLRN